MKCCNCIDSSQVAHLAASYREIGKYAILLVLVTRVGLQTFALGVVPQLQCVVEGGGQYVFAVGGEFDKANGWIVIIDQRLQALSAGRVPNATEPIIAGADNQRAITIEMHCRNGIGVSGQCLQAFASTHIPNAYALIEAARHNQIRLWIEVTAEDIIAVTLERL